MSTTQGSPMIVGEALSDELGRLKTLREQSERTVQQIGLNRVMEQRLLSQLQGIERSFHQEQQKIGARLGIPDGTPWQMSGDGKVVITVIPKDEAPVGA